MSDTCPKCGFAKSADSCPKCGLVFDKFNPELLDTEAPESIKTLWENVLSHWDDEASHALFIEQALALNALPYAASCYRRRGEDPIAQAQLGKIVVRLQQTLMVNPQKRPRRLFKRSPAMALASILLGCVLVYLIFEFML